jgi:hypothetical protein
MAINVGHSSHLFSSLRGAMQTGESVIASLRRILENYLLQRHVSGATTPEEACFKRNFSRNCLEEEIFYSPNTYSS